MNNYKYDLIVEVRRGFNLENKKWIGSNAPYVQIKIGDEIEKTHDSFELENPVWNARLLFQLNDIPKTIEFQVKDDSLFSDPILGDYVININNTNELTTAQPCVVHDGIIELQNSNQGRLDIKITIENNLLKAEQNVSNVINNNSNNNMIEQQKIYRHVLPPIRIKENPIIVEKEIIYQKPIEIRQTIIHKEKPIIIEQHTIKEKYEHYRESAQYIKEEEKVVRDIVNQDINSNQDAILEKLRAQKIEEHRDVSPIIHYQKQHIHLQTDIRVQPDQIYEKEIIYEQPVEIQKTQIEKLKSKVVEEVTLEKNHIHQKLSPEFHVQEPKKNI